MKEAELDISHSFYMILHHLWMSSKINSGMFELVDSAQHAADCAVQHGQRILEAQEKARNWST